MRHIRYGLLLAVGAFYVPAGAQEHVRLFFDVSGNAGSDAAPHPGSETLSYTNPTLPAGGERLFIYAEFLGPPDITFVSFSYDITVDGGSITEAWNYNGYGQQLFTNDQRWDFAEPNPAVNPGDVFVGFPSVNLTHMGLGNSALHGALDVQHDDSRNFGDTLLGYVDVVGEPGATIWMTILEPGIIFGNQGLFARVFLGFGDDPVRTSQIGVRTQMPEATIVPEPGTWALLLLTGLFGAHRR